MDEDGNVVATYEYDAWGKITAATGTAAGTPGDLNPLRYRGYYYDTETGLYYLQSRYYNPEWGRFISPDDVEVLEVTQGELLSHNLYMYCNANPVNMVDPDGYRATAVLAPVALKYGWLIFVPGVGQVAKSLVVLAAVVGSAWLVARHGVPWAVRRYWRITASIRANKQVREAARGMTNTQREHFYVEVHKEKKGRGMRPNDNLPWKELLSIAANIRKNYK